MTFRLSRSNNVLEPLEVFLRFTRESFLIAAIFIILVAVTLALKYVAALVTDNNHGPLLEGLEYSIFIASYLSALLVIIFMTIITAVEMFRGFREIVLEKGSASARGSIDEKLGDKIVDPPAVGGKEPGRSSQFYFVSTLLFLGLLGSLELSQRQIASIRKNQDRQNAITAHTLKGLKEVAVENFGEACRAGRGVFDGNSLVCRFPDGRILLWRNID